MQLEINVSMGHGSRVLDDSHELPNARPFLHPRAIQDARSRSSCLSASFIRRTSGHSVGSTLTTLLSCNDVQFSRFGLYFWSIRLATMLRTDPPPASRRVFASGTISAAKLARNERIDFHRLEKYFPRSVVKASVLNSQFSIYNKEKEKETLKGEKGRNCLVITVSPIHGVREGKP